MQGDAQDYTNLALTEQRGADNRIYIARIRWAAANRHASVTLGAGCSDAVRVTQNGEAP